MSTLHETSHDATHDAARETGAHPVNIGHLVMAVALLGLVGVWALWQGDVVDGDDLRWLMPVPWVAAGLTGLAASALTGGRRHRTQQRGWVGEPDGTGQPGQAAERDLTSEAEPFTAEPTTQQTEKPAAQPSAPPTVPPASPNADQQ